MQFQILDKLFSGDRQGRCQASSLVVLSDPLGDDITMAADLTRDARRSRGKGSSFNSRCEDCLHLRASKDRNNFMNHRHRMPLESLVITANTRNGVTVRAIVDQERDDERLEQQGGDNLSTLFDSPTAVNQDRSNQRFEDICEGFGWVEFRIKESTDGATCCPMRRDGRAGEEAESIDDRPLNRSR